MSPATRHRFDSIDVTERPWRMRLPFHFGVVTMREASEIHLACRIAVPGRAVLTGYSAEMAVPKWFNKDPALTPDETVDRLRDAVGRVVAIALGAGAISHDELEHLARADSGIAAARLNGLEISFALALLERAAIDAGCRAAGLGFASFVAADGLDLVGSWSCGADLPLAAWLAGLQPTSSIAVRHTVGLSDPLERAEVEDPFIGGRAVALTDVIASDRVRHFKVKFAGNDDEFARLRRLARILDASGTDYFVSLDANEAFRDIETFAAVTSAFAADAVLAAFWDRVAYIEQPFDRAIALDLDVRRLNIGKSLIIDESDDRPEAFADALRCGYRGVSVKTCKGVRRAVANAALAARETAQGRLAFITSEDLTVQPGIALQQNIALGGTLGLTHAERNGHHFGPGPAGLPPSERVDFVRLHPDVYSVDGIVTRDGAISTASTLAAHGFGTSVRPS